MGTSIVTMGVRVRPLEPVATVGALLGLSRGQAFRHAATWPTVGSAGARRVIVPALLDQLGIPFEVQGAPVPETEAATTVGPS